MFQLFSRTYTGQAEMKYDELLEKWSADLSNYLKRIPDHRWQQKYHLNQICVLIGLLIKFWFTSVYIYTLIIYC